MPTTTKPRSTASKKRVAAAAATSADEAQKSTKKAAGPAKAAATNRNVGTTRAATKVDASRPAGVDEPWDGDPAKIPDYKADTDIVSAVISQFGLIRGVWGKIRAAGVIVLRLLP